MTIASFDTVPFFQKGDTKFYLEHVYVIYMQVSLGYFRGKGTQLITRGVGCIGVS